MPSTDECTDVVVLGVKVNRSPCSYGGQYLFAIKSTNILAGWGRGKKGTLPANPLIFKKPVRP